MACSSSVLEVGAKLVVGDLDVPSDEDAVVVEKDAINGEMKASFNGDYLDDGSYSSANLDGATTHSVDCVPGIARSLGWVRAGEAVGTAMGVVGVIEVGWGGAASGRIGCDFD